MNTISKHFLEVAETLSLVDDQAILRTIEILKIVRAAQGTVWLAGNGGSAATASHFANDLTKMGKVKALSVADFTPTTLAYGNDNGWDKMFSDTLEAHMGPKDAVIGISCSGNSRNIITFLAMAKNRYKIGLTGPGQNAMTEMKPAPDVIIRAMADEITVQEDIHSIVCHAIARSLRDA